MADNLTVNNIDLQNTFKVKNAVDPSSAQEYVTLNHFNNNVLPLVGNATNDPTGFLNLTDSTYTWDDLTRTFEITPSSTSYSFYVMGTLFGKSVAESISIPDVTGFYHFFYDTAGVLTYQLAFDLFIIKSSAYIASVYWDADDQTALFVGEERHGLMPWQVHYYLHENLGARYSSGFALSGFNIDGDGTANTHSQFVGNSGQFFDEDILHIMSAPTNIPILYKLGLSTWKKKAGDSYPLIYDGTAGYTATNGRIPFNEFTGGAWQLTEADENSYILIHYFGINDPNQPVMGILGTNQYLDINSARTAAHNEISTLTGLIFQEFIPIGTVIFKTSSAFTNDTKAVTISTDIGTEYLDFRTTKSYTIVGGGVNSHSLLSDLNNDDHTQYLNITRGDLRYYTQGQIDTALSSKQDSDADLTAIAALTTTGIITRTGAGTVSTRTITGTLNRITISNGDGVSGNPTLDIGTDIVTLTGTQTLTNKTIGVSQLSGQVSIGNGGTGASTANDALNNLLPSQATHNTHALISDGTNTAWTDISLKLYKENPSSPAANTTSGNNSLVLGQGNTASGQDSAVLGGNNNTASATYSFALGKDAASNLYGGFAQASGFFSSVGDAQTRVLILRANTTNATETEMFLDGNSERLVLPNDTTWFFRISISARRTDADGESAAYEMTGCIDRNTNAASTALVGTRNRTVVAEDNAAWQVEAVADTTNGSLKITVRGQAAKNIRWVGRIELTEVTG